jgi:uncharacterized protein
VIYVDTSVIVALLTLEPSSAAAKRWYAALADTPVSAEWCITETASALAIKRRMGQIDTAAFDAAWAAFERMLDGGLQTSPVSRATFESAARLCAADDSDLRAGDALHLAAALEAGATHLATFDARQAAGAAKAGLVLTEVA